MSYPMWMSEEGIKTVNKGLLLPNEEISDAWKRVCRYSAKFLNIEGYEEDLYDVLSKGYLGLATPVLSNFGTNRGLPISCYSVELPDSINGMFSQFKHMAALSKNGGGVGCYWNNVRPAGSTISDNNGKTNGSVPFAVLGDRVASTVSQGGVRRGSFAHYWRIDHPDIKQVLLTKDHNVDVRQYIDGNIALVIPDYWLEELINGDREKAEIMNLALKTRLKTGSPYFIFIDTINRLTPDAYRIHNLLVKTSNICSEICLFTDFDHTFVCCLSSINQSKYFEIKKYRSPNLGLTVPELGIYLLDTVISDFIIKTSHLPEWISNNQKLKDLTKNIPFGFKEGLYNIYEFFSRRFFEKFYKYPSMGRARRSALKGRALGLGSMGLSDLFQKQNLMWGSKEAIELDVEIHKWQLEKCRKASKLLAEKFGKPIWCKGTDYRNSHLVALAPTKTNAAVCNTSEGISPYESNYGLAAQGKGTFLRTNPNVIKLLEKYNLNNYETLENISLNNGSIMQIPEIPIKDKLVYLTMRELDPVKTMIGHAIFRQPYVDQAMSLNLPASPYSSVKSLLKPVIAAWKGDVKTLYYNKSSSSTSLENLMGIAYIITKPDCDFCKKAKELLDKYNYKVVEYNREECEDNFIWETVPVIWADGYFIGGYTDLVEYFDVLFKDGKKDFSKLNFEQEEIENCLACEA